ncbi:Peroxidase 21 [Castilleja foliolosa]|uniref:Peroxidase n=1 Tax=Castilleja foliolosa TaxID=1961234 RepID=A0ABD3CF89_9LAMI
MANFTFKFGPTFIFVLLPLLLQFHSGKSELQFNYYKESCPRAEEIIKEQVELLYYKHGNTAVSWIRTLFHDCIVGGCDASLLLETVKGGVKSEQTASGNFGMRNFKYIKTIKDALEKACPVTVSCADIIALSAKEGSIMLKGPVIEIKTGRKDGKQSYASLVDQSIPHHNVTMSTVLSTFQKIGIDTEGAVALFGAHSVGRVHCVNLVPRLYPTIDPTLDPAYAKYLIGRCPSPIPNPEAVEYSRNDRVTTMILDNMYYKNILGHKGLLVVDQELVSDPRTYPFVQKMAADNGYFHAQFARAMTILSEYNLITGNQGEIRKDCRFVNH